MTLQEYCDTLPKAKQYELAVTLAWKALPVWTKYSDQHQFQLPNRDPIVTMIHRLPKKLLKDVIHEVEHWLSTSALSRVLRDNTRLLELYAYFDDPVMALQRDDWKLPEPVEKVFYAVYNLLGSVVDKEIATSGESIIYISINQSIDSMLKSKSVKDTKIVKILEQIKKRH